ncbi:mitochondrial large subunit ribosomal protein [Cardiosporidium cionae]|uniref:Large ribosomal subunit protein mL49 n=1 Tax=Cardiosporidium cionae TaxID=476202 RepID=A0ABQ7J7M2_9APIC|nr:mitochondrial large subunit ribosomal protein [Cardiosporidium cionae]|eukprot:KAF8819979.1 mitochondrial large subunit ribosomal protein [Cardiosporidium cionae]
MSALLPVNPTTSAVCGGQFFWSFRSLTHSQYFISLRHYCHWVPFPFKASEAACTSIFGKGSQATHIPPAGCLRGITSDSNASTTISLPFRVYRTASENIPVYLRWRNNRNAVSTIILKVRGNRMAFRQELETLCESTVCEHSHFFEVKGNHKFKIKQVLGVWKNITYFSF